jgi:hypothetical protein
MNFGIIKAQIEKGSIFLGTSTSVTGSSYSFLTNSDNSLGITFSSIEWSGDDEKENFTVLNFSPKLGYFPVNNLVIGANLKLWTQKMEDDKTSVTGIGPFVRYYFTNGKIVPFAEAEVTFSKYKETWDSEYSDGESTENLTMLALGGGLAFFVNDFISIDCMLGYKTLKLKDAESSDDSEISFNNFGLSIGFTATF